jgi:hypothetical protein
MQLEDARIFPGPPIEQIPESRRTIRSVGVPPRLDRQLLFPHAAPRELVAACDKEMAL